MKAQFQGTCVRCGTRFPVGVEIKPARGGYIAGDCLPQDVQVRYVTPSMPGRQVPPRRKKKVEEKFKISNAKTLRPARNRGRMS